MEKVINSQSIVKQNYAKIELPEFILERYSIFEHYGVSISDNNSFDAPNTPLNLKSTKPFDCSLKDELRFILNREVFFEFGDKQDIARWLTSVKNIKPSSASKIVTKRDVVSGVSFSPIVSLVNSIIFSAIRTGASDIHFEPFCEELKVRYRIDGVLREVHSIPKSRLPEVISRLKIMSNLDIAEKRRPQDGRIRLDHDKSLIDIRVSTMPTEYGEKMVLRILDKSNLKLDVSKIGLSESHISTVKKALIAPYGMILVSGPTGSGKTTTLYAALNHIRKPDINISTIEDPIEYNLEGVNQSQVKPEIGYTFASAIRTFLRQDPNVIMVGEIRDSETAIIANRAAMTGHLVLSTIHTNDAPTTLSRLLDLGLESFHIASSLSLVIAQRLVRKNCEHCKKKVSVTENERVVWGLEIDHFYTGSGCDVCGQTGYKGRIGLFEIMPINNELRELITNKVSSHEIRLAAIKSGLVGLREDGIEKIKLGLTTPSEVVRETMSAASSI